MNKLRTELFDLNFSKATTKDQVEKMKIDIEIRKVKLKIAKKIKTKLEKENEVKNNEEHKRR